MSSERAGPIAACVAVALWGMGNDLIKRIPLSGLSVAFNRLWLGAIVFTLLLLLTGGRLTWRSLRLAAPGGIAFGLDVSLFFVSVKHTSVADASIINALQPALVLLVAGRLFGERVTGRGLAATGVALAGVIGAVFASSSTAGRTTHGDLLSVVALVAWAWYFVASKQARQQMGALEYQAALTIVAAVVVTPIALIGAHDLVITTPSNFGWIALMVLVPGTGHLLMNWAHGHVPIVLASTLTLGIAVVATIGAVVFLNEGTTAAQVACMVAVLAALGVVIHQGPAPDLAEVAAQE